MVATPVFKGEWLWGTELDSGWLELCPPCHDPSAKPMFVPTAACTAATTRPSTESENAIKAAWEVLRSPAAAPPNALVQTIHYGCPSVEVWQSAVLETAAAFTQTEHEIHNGSVEVVLKLPSMSPSELQQTEKRLGVERLQHTPPVEAAEIVFGW